MFPLTGLDKLLLKLLAMGSLIAVDVTANLFYGLFLSFWLNILLTLGASSAFVYGLYCKDYD